MKLSTEWLCNTQGGVTYCERGPDQPSLWTRMEVPSVHDVLADIHGRLGDPFYDVYIWTLRGMGIILALLILQYQFKRYRSLYPRVKKQGNYYGPRGGSNEETADQDYQLT